MLPTLEKKISQLHKLVESNTHKIFKLHEALGSTEDRTAKLLNDQSIKQIKNWIILKHHVYSLRCQITHLKMETVDSMKMFVHLFQSAFKGYLESTSELYKVLDIFAIFGYTVLFNFVACLDFSIVWIRAYLMSLK